MCRGGLFIRGSDLFIKIEEGLILAGAVHTGGEHPVGGIVFLIAFGDDVGEVEPVERPVGDGGERLRAVAVAREVRRDTAAELRAAAGIKAVEDDLADECAVEPDGKVHGAGAGAVLPRDGEKVVLVGRVPPERQYLGQRLKLTWGESVTVAGFYPPATVYTVRRSVRLMAAVSRLMTMKNRKLLQLIFNLGGEYGSKMVMQQRPNRRCAALIPQLEELYEQALERFPVLWKQGCRYK